jgi:hypothetical protein
LSRYEDEANLPLYNFTSEKFTDAFRHVSNNPIIWKSLKSLLENYFYWLKDQGIDVGTGLYALDHINEKELKGNITKQFFYSTNQVLAKLDADIKWVSDLDDRYTDDYCMIESSILLSWFGLELKDVVKFKKSDIGMRRSTIKVHGIWTMIPDAATEKLYDCATALGYIKNTGAGQVLFKYEDSEYLLRTNVSDTISVSTMSSFLSIFNKKLSPDSTPYSYGKAYWSGVYFRAYQAEKRIGGVPEFKSNSEKMDFYSHLFREQIGSISSLVNRIEEYKLYKSVF